ncbi:MAG: CDP-diacylglycerol--glycerol-3-phosphate 3-phosphatidyltransferase, partial [Verrucomicrobia bacterium]|nr:CDP-diacylglycerol--glycerol-3-phosphate 3-phosphatidyltransferase [Verrucomicrobiota bacterium]
MTTPNKITITRICLIPVFVTFSILYGAGVQSGEPNLNLRIAALVTFAIAALSDGLDG